MKKLIPLILATSLSSNVLANETLSTKPLTKEERNFYLKAGVGLNQIDKIKFSNHHFEGKVKLADRFPLVELGIGYHFNESIRADLILDYYFLFRANENSINPNNDSYNITSKTKANALMVNIYKDIITIGNFTPFIGAGVGVATLKESANGYAVSSEDNAHYSLDSISGKTVNRVAYKLTFGADVGLSDNVTAEMSYNYFNLGNNKSKIVGGIHNIGNRNYGIHNITLGLRFNI